MSSARYAPMEESPTQMARKQGQFEIKRGLGLTKADNTQAARVLAKQTRDAYVASGALASAAPALHDTMTADQYAAAAAKTKALHYQYKPDHAAAHYGTTDATAMPAKNDFAARGLNQDGSVPVSDTPQGPITQAAAPTPGTIGQSNLQKAFPGWENMKPAERTAALQSKLGQGFNGNNAAPQQRAGVFDLLQSDGGVIRDGRIVKPNSNTSAAPTLASIESRYGNGARGTYTPAPASPLAQAAAPTIPPPSTGMANKDSYPAVNWVPPPTQESDLFPPLTASASPVSTAPKVSPQTGLPFSPNSTDAIGTRTAPKDNSIVPNAFASNPVQSLFSPKPGPIASAAAPVSPRDNQGAADALNSTLTDVRTEQDAALKKRKSLAVR